MTPRLRLVLWVARNGFALCLVLHVLMLTSLTAGDCGFPGTPANGTLSSDGLTRLPTGGGVAAKGVVVQYSCSPGYVLFGDLQRECLSNDTWSGEVPTCDLNLAAQKKASQSETFFNYTADLAVDGRLDTWSYTPMIVNRWWQVHLGKTYVVARVAVTMGAGNTHKFTVFVVSLGAGDEFEHELCGTFDGKFESDTVVLVCNHGYGQVGEHIFIRDDRFDLMYFGLCEVGVFTRRDLHLCGEPETSLHGRSSRLDTGTVVEFTCAPGYKLVGASRLACFEGRWNGPVPKCRDVACQMPPDIQHATIHINTSEKRFLVGTIANYTCEIGFFMLGNGTHICDEHGSWKGDLPRCEAIDCGPPPLVPHGTLLANATTWGNVGVLQCDEGFQQVGEALVMCGHLGQWLVDNATCRDSVALLEGDMPGFGKVSNSSGVVMGSIVAIIVTLAAILLISFLRRRWGSQSGSVSDDLKISSSPEGYRAGDGLADALYDDVSYSNSGFHSDAPGSSVPDDDDEELYADAGIPGAVGGNDGMQLYDHPTGDDEEPIYYTPVEMNCKTGEMIWNGSEQDKGHENPVYEPLDASHLDAAIYARIDIEKKRKDREENFNSGQASTAPPVDDSVNENVEYCGGSIVGDGGGFEDPAASSLESLSPLPSPRPLPPIPSETFEAMDNELHSPMVPEESQDEAQWEKCESISAAALEPTSSSASSAEGITDQSQGNT